MEHKTSPAVLWFWAVVAVLLIGSIIGSGDSGTYEAPTCYYAEHYDASICSDGTTR